MNEDPFACMRSGKIRNDLFFRLSTVILEVPPLRQRRDDIPLLAEYFLKKFCPQGPGKTLSRTLPPCYPATTGPAMSAS